MLRTLKSLPLVAMFLLGGCVTLPSGPSVLVLPGTDKSFDQFQTDEVVCRQFAYVQVGGRTPSQAAAASGVTSAAVGSALGAASGAAIGGGTGAAIGAGSGLAAGGLVGAGTALVRSPRLACDGAFGVIGWVPDGVMRFTAPGFGLVFTAP